MEIEVKEATITKLNTDNGNKTLSQVLYKTCCFCDKMVRTHSCNLKSCLKMGGNKFYCPFCLRHDFNYKSNKNVLIFSFKSIIGYYYYKLYLGKSKTMWYSQIDDLIKQHAKVGLYSPALSYDLDTYLWFVNFNKIGNHPKKAPFSEVRQTIKIIYDIFNAEKRISKYESDKFWEKFEKAIDIFYEKRQRPKDKKMLIPTIGILNDKLKEKVKNFSKAKFLLKK